MLRYYCKIAWRHLKKNRQFSFLNLLGLSTGLGCVLLIGLWVNDEYGMDRFPDKGARLFQVMQNIKLGDGGIQTTDHTPGILARTLAAEMPEVEQAAVIRFPARMENPVGILSHDDDRIKARELYVTSNFFTTFSFRLLQGDPGGVFSNKYAVVLSEETAMRLFHTTKDVIGRQVTWDRGQGGFSGNVTGSYVVGGIMENPPPNSSLQFDALFSYELYYERNTRYLDNWGSSNPATYVIVKPGTDMSRFNAKLRGFMKAKYVAVNGPQNADWVGTLFAQRYEDRYLYNRYENGVPVGGRIEYVHLFTIVALFVLVIACINFMNLSTASAAGRMKELGVRKVIGARRYALIVQYLVESLMLAFLALGGALLLALLFLPAFRGLTGKDLSLQPDIREVLWVLAITGLTGLLAGSYPALYLSGFRPALILKGKLRASASESGVRKGLVVFQFSISVILIVSVLVVRRQMALIQTRDLGYNKDQVIHFTNEGEINQHLGLFLDAVRNVPGVADATAMNGNMVGNHSGGGGLNWDGKDPSLAIEYSGLYVNYHFIETLGLKMVEGRPFSPLFASDSASVIFNETAIRAMQIKDPIGKTVTMWGHKKQIIGIVKDFHFESLYNKVGPLFLTYLPENSSILVKIRGGSEKQTLARLQQFYKGYNRGLPFEYRFLDEDFQDLYASEQRVAVLSRCFAGIAILVSCLGLFGLAAYTAQKRQKEIAIRKVVGASANHIAAMLSTDFLKWVAIAFGIGFPIAWWAMHRWLDGFAYRVSIGPGLFVLAGASVLLLTLLTIGYQSIKAALANPAKALRSE